jgi:aminomethyltransferase
MVDFAGWDMPVQYTSIVEEHRAVREAVGLFDISHMGRLWFDGPEALEFVQKVFTNNAATLNEGQARYGLICNEKGGIRDDVLIYRWPDGLGMVVNASNREKIVAWIAQTASRGASAPGVPSRVASAPGVQALRVLDTTKDSCMIAVQGPRALDCCRGVTPAPIGELDYYHACRTTYKGKASAVSRTGYTGEDGFEFIVSAEQGPQLWEELFARGGKPCGLGARDTLRLEAAMALYGHELSEEVDPFQAGLGWAVKMDKGDFIGREALVRLRQDKSRPRRVGLELQGKRIAREGAAVLHEGRVIGRLTSGTFSPTLDKVIGMAYVDPSSAQPGAACDVDIRGKPVPARVVPLPFYKRRNKVASSQ